MVHDVVWPTPKHLKVRSMQCTPFEADTASSGDGKQMSLSIPPDKSGITTLSSELLERTWNKAEKLLSTYSRKCLWSSSYARCHVCCQGKPHMVCKTKKGSFACDEACLAWKSQKLCNHILAVCEEKNAWKNFWLQVQEVTLLYPLIVSPKMLVWNQGVRSEKVHLSTRSQSYVDPFTNSDVSQTSCGTSQSCSYHSLYSICFKPSI